jgi:hypothetical protein
MKNLFNANEAQEMITRIHQLTPTTKPQWGKMSVDQMLAHCNVAYEMTYANHQNRPNVFSRLMMKWFVRPVVVGAKPYGKNSRTAPAFVIEGSRDFDEEKKRLIDFIEKTQVLGAAHFEGKESHSLGKLTSQEWNVMFSKHLNHHLTQFGV